MCINVCVHYCSSIIAPCLVLDVLLCGCSCLCSCSSASCSSVSTGIVNCHCVNCQLLGSLCEPASVSDEPLGCFSLWGGSEEAQGSLRGASVGEPLSSGELLGNIWELGEAWQLLRSHRDLWGSFVSGVVLGELLGGFLGAAGEPATASSSGGLCEPGQL